MSLENTDHVALMAASTRDALRLIDQLRALPDISEAIMKDVRKEEGGANAPR